MTPRNTYRSLDEHLAPLPKPPHANRRWSSAESIKLMVLSGEGKNPREIADVLGRTEVAIRVKLSKLGGLRQAFR